MRRRRHAAANIRSPGFLHVDGVLEDSCRRNLIHHLTVVPAAHASFVKVAVRCDTAQALVNEVHGYVPATAMKFRDQQLCVLGGHPRGGVFFPLHGARKANDDLDRAKVLNERRDHADVGILLRVAVKGLERGCQDCVAVADGHAHTDGAHVHPQFDALGVDGGRGR
jgi:hypothetical protein